MYSRWDLDFKLDRAERGEVRVAPGGVVEALDVVADGGGAAGSDGDVLVVDVLGREGLRRTSRRRASSEQSAAQLALATMPRSGWALAMLFACLGPARSAAPSPA
jgi:hypothetical protein